MEQPSGEIKYSKAERKKAIEKACKYEVLIKKQSDDALLASLELLENGLDDNIISPMEVVTDYLAWPGDLLTGKSYRRGELQFNFVLKSWAKAHEKYFSLLNKCLRLQAQEKMSLVYKLDQCHQNLVHRLYEVPSILTSYSRYLMGWSDQGPEPYSAARQAYVKFRDGIGDLIDKYDKEFVKPYMALSTSEPNEIIAFLKKLQDDVTQKKISFDDVICLLMQERHEDGDGITLGAELILNNQFLAYHHYVELLITCFDEGANPESVRDCHKLVREYMSNKSNPGITGGLHDFVSGESENEINEHYAEFSSERSHQFKSKITDAARAAHQSSRKLKKKFSEIRKKKHLAIIENAFSGEEDRIIENFDSLKQDINDGNLTPDFVVELLIKDSDQLQNKKGYDATKALAGRLLKAKQHVAYKHMILLFRFCLDNGASVEAFSKHFKMMLKSLSSNVGYLANGMPQASEMRFILGHPKKDLIQYTDQDATADAILARGAFIQLRDSVNDKLYSDDWKNGKSLEYHPLSKHLDNFSTPGERMIYLKEYIGNLYRLPGRPRKQMVATYWFAAHALSYNLIELAKKNNNSLIITHLLVLLHSPEIKEQLYAKEYVIYDELVFKIIWDGHIIKNDEFFQQLSKRTEKHAISCKKHCNDLIIKSKDSEIKTLLEKLVVKDIPRIDDNKDPRAYENFLWHKFIRHQARLFGTPSITRKTCQLSRDNVRHWALQLMSALNAKKPNLIKVDECIEELSVLEVKHGCSMDDAISVDDNGKVTDLAQMKTQYQELKKSKTPASNGTAQISKPSKADTARVWADSLREKDEPSISRELAGLEDRLNKGMISPHDVVAQLGTSVKPEYNSGTIATWFVKDNKLEAFECYLVLLNKCLVKCGNEDPPLVDNIEECLGEKFWFQLEQVFSTSEDDKLWNYLEQVIINSGKNVNESETYTHMCSICAGYAALKKGIDKIKSKHAEFKQAYLNLSMENTKSITSYLRQLQKSVQEKEIPSDKVVWLLTQKQLFQTTLGARLVLWKCFSVYQQYTDLLITCLDNGANPEAVGHCDKVTRFNVYEAGGGNITIATYDFVFGTSEKHVTKLLETPVQRTKFKLMIQKEDVASARMTSIKLKEKMLEKKYITVFLAHDNYDGETKIIAFLESLKNDLIDRKTISADFVIALLAKDRDELLKGKMCGHGYGKLAALLVSRGKYAAYKHIIELFQMCLDHGASAKTIDECFRNKLFLSFINMAFMPKKDSEMRFVQGYAERFRPFYENRSKEAILARKAHIQLRNSLSVKLYSNEWKKGNKLEEHPLSKHLDNLISNDEKLAYLEKYMRIIGSENYLSNNKNPQYKFSAHALSFNLRRLASEARNGYKYTNIEYLFKTLSEEKQQWWEGATNTLMLLYSPEIKDPLDKNEYVIYNEYMFNMIMNGLVLPKDKFFQYLSNRTKKHEISCKEHCTNSLINTKDSEIKTTLEKVVTDKEIRLKGVYDGTYKLRHVFLYKLFLHKADWYGTTPSITDKTCQFSRANVRHTALQLMSALNANNMTKAEEHIKTLNVLAIKHGCSMKDAISVADDGKTTSLSQMLAHDVLLNSNVPAKDAYIKLFCHLQLKDDLPEKVKILSVITTKRPSDKAKTTNWYEFYNDDIDFTQLEALEINYYMIELYNALFGEQKNDNTLDIHSLMTNFKKILILASDNEVGFKLPTIMVRKSHQSTATVFSKKIQAGIQQVTLIDLLSQAQKTECKDNTRFSSELDSFKRALSATSERRLTVKKALTGQVTVSYGPQNNYQDSKL